MLVSLLLKEMSIEKSWSIYKFISLANKIAARGKVPVFFIEKNDIDLISKIKNRSSAIFLKYIQNYHVLHY